MTELLAAALVLAFFGFAIFGFVEFVRRMRHGVNDGESASLMRALDRMLAADLITVSEYQRIRKSLRKRGLTGSLPPLDIRQDSTTPAGGVMPPETSADAPTLPVKESQATEPVLATLVSPPSKPPSPPRAPDWLSAPASPALEPKPPRRSMQDVMAGFMQEKNIRWGELASGILIVGSAVGLVVSLREELQKTIPYFPALVFMLLTAAIHAAGIYTLKRWRLRNTSRGVLIIGLLLVPLNFLAACILTGSGPRMRALSDPVYWLAVVVGLVCFSAMTWYSSKFLLRRGNVSLFIGVLGSSVSLLVTNRVPDLHATSWLPTLVCMPALASFVIGVSTFDRNQWSRERWTERISRRMYLILGICIFSLFVAVSLVIVRAEEKWHAIVSVAPILCCSSMLTAWLGLLIQQGCCGRAATTIRIVGMSLAALGLSAASVMLLISVANPGVLVVTSIVCGSIAAGMSINRKRAELLPLTWVSLSLATWSVMNMLIGRFQLGAWASLLELKRAVLSGAAGLCFMALGGIVLVLQWKVPWKSWAGERFAGKQRQIGLISGGAIAAVGCTTAAFASLLNRADVFDQYVATALLGVATVVLLALSNTIFSDRARWAHGLAAMTLAFLAHGLLWNQFLAAKIVQLAWGIDIRLELVAGLLALSCAAYMVPIRISNRGNCREWTDALGAWVVGGSVIAIIESFRLLPLHTGLATSCVLIVVVAAFVVAWSHRSAIAANGFALATFLLLLIAVGEVCLQQGWVRSEWSLRLSLIQAICLSGWSIGWSVLFGYGNRTSLRGWLLPEETRFPDFALGGLVTFTVSAVVIGLAPHLARELSATIEANPIHGLPLSENRFLVSAALLCVGAAIAFALLERAVVWQGGALILLWMSGWGVGGLYFEPSNSVATAVRWLFPIGGAVGAVFMAVRFVLYERWPEVRSTLRLEQRRLWPSVQTQHLINMWLAVVVGVSLSIATIAITQVMLNGVGSLGGPDWPFFFAKLRKDVSYGVPIGIIVGIFLLYAITERRGLLAVAGSGVYQYFVALSVVLLFLSPHPKLASEWFLNIMQAVSLGMTGYGLVWYVFRTRIGVRTIFGANRFTQLELHTTLNCVLVASLATLIVARFFLYPSVSAGWINEAGGWLGFAALVTVSVLAAIVWRPHARRYLACFCGVIGLTLVAFLASLVDRQFGSPPWWAFRTISMGATAAMFAPLWITWKRNGGAHGIQPAFEYFGPLLLCGSVAVLFAARGAWSDTGWFWGHLLSITATIIVVAIYSLTCESVWASFVAAGLVVVDAFLLVVIDPHGLFRGTDLSLVHVTVVGLLALAGMWVGFYIHHRPARERMPARRLMRMPNTVLWVGAAWVAFCGVLTRPEELTTPLGCTVILLSFALIVANLWNVHDYFRVWAPFLWAIGIGSLLAGLISSEREYRTVWRAVAWSSVVLLGGYVYSRKRELQFLGARLNMVRLVARKRALLRSLPRIDVAVVLVVVLTLIAVMFQYDRRELRYLAAFSPLLLGFGIHPLSDAGQRRWAQLLTLGLYTLAGIGVSLADVAPFEMQFDEVVLPTRCLLAFGIAMFAYGWLVPRRIGPDSEWTTSVREATLLTCLLCLFAFAALLWAESHNYQWDVGCGMALPTALVITLMVIAIISALIAVAITPKHDPLSLPIEFRQGYVYAAQVVAAMLVGHAFFTMPWLFRIGIRQYWPYLAMVLSFGGVAMSSTLRKRDLMVLGRPIFHTAAILPIIVTAAFWAVESRADAALTMLLAGLLYLMISASEKSLISGAVAMLFGNLALWLFYDKFPEFDFFLHPQLWLIPPAVSVLVAGQLNRERVSATQLATLRYLCVTVIYVSSTSEIFITGLGEQLWPPMVLALLSVAGIFAGIMLQVRAYIYLGCLFLLLSVVSMVAHAQQRLDHVWPWWAFGIGLGALILAMFGWFEKRRNDMPALRSKLREWDY